VRCLRLRSLELPPALARVAPLVSALGRELADRDLTGELDVAAGVLDDLADLLPVSSADHPRR
jgi:hypothetical protein